MRDADRVVNWCAEPRGESCRYVVTPNVDHAVMFQHRVDLRNAYDDASLVLADGLPLVIASRLFGRPLPQRVAGSDLVPQLFAAGKPLRVFLLGAAPGVAEAAAGVFESAVAGHRRGRHVFASARVSKTMPRKTNEFSPPSPRPRRICSSSASARPKQELWVHAHRGQLRAKVAICAGATIDFLAGDRRRSPALDAPRRT